MLRDSVLYIKIHKDIDQNDSLNNAKLDYYEPNLTHQYSLLPDMNS